MGLGGQHDVEGEGYVCQLPDKVKKIAEEELRESDSVREQSLQQMRDWIQKHQYIKRCRTGTYFILLYYYLFFQLIHEP